jgi:uncharacterized protein YjiS (DUF1127 family)
MHLLAQAKERTQKIYISFLRHLHVWWRYETAVRELWNLSDRELADLGITRKDIARVASEAPQPEDRARYRVRWHSRADLGCLPGDADHKCRRPVRLTKMPPNRERVRMMIDGHVTALYRRGGCLRLLRSFTTVFLPFAFCYFLSYVCSGPSTVRWPTNWSGISH